MDKQERIERKITKYNALLISAIMEIIDEENDAPKSPPKPKKTRVIVSSDKTFEEAHQEAVDKVREGTPFDSIPLDATDFNVFNVVIHRIGDPQTGLTKDNSTWNMRSMTIKDVQDKNRDVIAWGDLTKIFDSLRVGDFVDIGLLSKVTEYTNKRGVTTIQYQIGSKSEIQGAD